MNSQRLSSRIGALLALSLVVLCVAACDGKTKHVAGPTVTATVTASAEETQTFTSAPSATAATAKAACARMRSADTFGSVRGFELVASVVVPGDVDETIDELNALKEKMPDAEGPSFDDLVRVLTDIDDASAAGNGSNADTTTVEDDVTTISEFCTSHGYANPDKQS